MKKKNKDRLRKIRRALVIGKVMLQRGYTLLNVPMLALVGAGVVYPYALGHFPWLKMWQLAIFAFFVMLFAGWLDRKLRLLHEEQNYAVETNPMLLAGLKGDLKRKKGRKRKVFKG